MNKIASILLCFFLNYNSSISQEIIPIDTINWEISGDHLIEHYKGKNSIYLKGGSLQLKNTSFLNGTIEFDLFLKETPSFPGIYFRMADDNNGEQFYVRPHQSGNPDATQAAPIINGITPWQLLFGPRYSFPHEFKFDDWTHIKLVINDDKAQVYLDHSDKPQLSWMLTHGFEAGGIVLRGGGKEALHIADVIINPEATELKEFQAIDRDPIPGLIEEWEVSDKFEESLLSDCDNISTIIKDRTWDHKIKLEEGAAANISRKINLIDGKPGNTVFARIRIDSDSDQIKRFAFGYSDRVVAILNGKPIYKGNNRWKSRDYRYLGTVGLFDAIFLDLKKGENTLLFAVSEDFGGWLITGRFQSQDGLSIE